MTKFKECLTPFTEDHYIDLFTNQSYIDYINNINEVFDKKATITIDRTIPGVYSTSFEVNDVKYIFMARIKNKEAVIIFYPLDNELDMFKERKKYNAYLGILFGSLIESVTLMLKEKDLNRIIFSAEYKKLEKIYSLLNKSILKRFPEWKLEKTVRGSNGKLNYVYVKE